MTVTVTYPWVNWKLSINGRRRLHWRTEARLVKVARRAALFDTLPYITHFRTNKSLELVVEFYPPDNRVRDVEGAIEAAKPLIDGISDALKIDDSQFHIDWPPRFAEPVDGGKVLIHFRPIAEGRAV